MPRGVSTTLTPEQRSLRASIAAHHKHAKHDPVEGTVPARRAFNDRFLERARKLYGDLPAEDLARRAEHLRSAHFKQLALASSKARRARKGATRT